ncbi:DNA-dependent protein kinase catalytic subunit, partial [Armadillidium vulgare]
MRNSLEPIGILLLEKQHMRQKKVERVNEPVKKRARKELTFSSPSIKGDTTLWLNIAEMYKNLSHWDSVLGILKSEIGDLKSETIKALEAESEKNHIEAYKNYVNALKKETWDSPPSPQEQQVWEEWFITSAENLGQWEKVEEFIEKRFLSDGNDRCERLNKVWKLPQSVASFVLPSLVNAKLMKILQGSDDDGGLCNFINESRKNDRYRSILEVELGLQTSVLAVNQEEFELARSLLRTSQLSFLSRFLHCSLLSSTSLVEYLKIVQALSELKDFLKLYSLSNDDKKEEYIKNVVRSWSVVESEINTNITQTQFTMSSRKLYFNFLKPYLISDSEFLNKVNISSEISMVTLSLANSNPHLAQQHLVKLENIPKDEFMECKLNFLKTEVNVMRGNLKDSYGKLHYSIEAWCKYLGKINSYLSSNSSSYIESRYLLQESLLCLNICEAIRDLKDEWNPEDKFMKVLSQKFDVSHTRKEMWYSSLLKCGHNALLKADILLNNGCDDVDKNDLYGTITSFYESCLEEWKEYETDDEFTDAYVRFILKGMSSGSKNAHHTFPRLIYLLEQNTNLGISFLKQSQRVPAWMFLLWISHILIYLDKAPGEYLLPIIKLLAETYPQAVIYPFEVSKEAYTFTGAYGLQAKKSCEEIKCILDKHSLIYNFITALSLVHLPHLELKDKLNKIAKQKDKETMCRLLKECGNILKPPRQLKNSSGEKGIVYLKHDALLRKASEVFVKYFGQNGEKLKSLSVDMLLKGRKEMNDSLEMRNIKSFSRNLNDYSPWLATFNSSNYRDEIETPGQYQGLSKPIPEYHIKISSFNQNLLLMESLRVPMRITINGSDEKEHSFLIK